jgi:hypothetical protein
MVLFPQKTRACQPSLTFSKFIKAHFRKFQRNNLAQMSDNANYSFIDILAVFWTDFTNAMAWT